MELKLEEQRLLADFRRLGAGEKKELLDYAAFLVKKKSSAPGQEATAPGNQCRLDDQPEQRPEAANEPLFTE